MQHCNLTITTCKLYIPKVNFNGTHTLLIIFFVYVYHILQYNICWQRLQKGDYATWVALLHSHLCIYPIDASMHCIDQFESSRSYILYNWEFLIFFSLHFAENSGHQSTTFNSMANVQVGGKLARNGRNRIERPFLGVIAGLSVNRLRVLDLASERDPHITVHGEVQLVTGVLDRNDLQRMQQVRIFTEESQTYTFTHSLFFSRCSLLVNR